MRIVLTCNYSPWSAYSGGGQRSTHNLARTLAARGHDVTVVFTKVPFERVAPPERLPYRLEWASLLDYRSRRQAPLRPLTAFSVAWAVRRHARRPGPLVVHAQGEEAAVLPALRRRYPFGLVVTPRYPSLPEELSGAGGAGLLGTVRLHVVDTKYVTLGAALRGADFCSPPSHYAGRLMQRAYGLRDAQIRPVHNGVPVEFLEYRWAPGDPERPLLFFGRFSPSKGVDTLLDALARLGAGAPRAVLVGRGRLQGEMQRRAVELGLGERVTFLPWADHHTLGRLLTEASMACIPSREENFSLAVLACMAVGTPLVTTPVGGTPEVVTHGETGLLFEAGDVAGLSEAIRRLRGAPEDAAALGRAARDRVREGFTWEATAGKFERLYAESLGQG